jgi:hypothetical protein
MRLGEGNDILNKKEEKLHKVADELLKNRFLTLQWR